MKKILLHFILLGNLMFGQNVCLDQSFGSAGTATASIGVYGDQIRALKIQSDGKIVAAGIVSTTAGFYYGYARFNFNGSLDNSFGSGGIVSNSTGSGYLFDMEVQSDGKIIGVGSEFSASQPDMKLQRMNANGAPDASFGSNGSVTTTIAGSEEITALCIQSDGKYLVAGNRSVGPSSVFIVARYDTNGNLDNTFGSSGTVAIQPGTNESYATDIVQLPGGGILVCGSTDVGSSLDFCVVKLTGTGVLDNTFGVNGVVTTSLGAWNDMCNTMGVFNDGKIIIGGTAMTNVSGDSDFALVKYNSNGTLDNTFGNNGKLMMNIGQWDKLNDLKIQPNGKIVVGGSTYGSTNPQFTTLMRFNTDGSLDNTSFGTQGVATASVGYFSNCQELAIQSDGNIVTGGEGLPSGSYPYEFCVLRFAGITIGTNEISSKGEAIVFPNPTASLLKIHSDKLIRECKVFNSLGVEVSHQKNINATEYSFNVADLPKGVYFAEIVNNGNYRSLTKFIKE